MTEQEKKLMLWLLERAVEDTRYAKTTRNSFVVIKCKLKKELSE